VTCKHSKITHFLASHEGNAKNLEGQGNGDLAELEGVKGKRGGQGGGEIGNQNPRHRGFGGSPPERRTKNAKGGGIGHGEFWKG